MNNTDLDIVEKDECNICFYELGYCHIDGDIWLPFSTNCNHMFHYRCIMMWGKSCPLCRTELPTIMGYRILVKTNIHANSYIKKIKFWLSYNDSLYVLLQLIHELSEINTKYLKFNKMLLLNCNNKMYKEVKLPRNPDLGIKICDIFDYSWMRIKTDDYIGVSIELIGKKLNSINKHPGKYEFHEIQNESIESTESICIII